MTLEVDSIMRLINYDEYNPHHILGLHDDDRGGKVIRLWRPGAEKVYLELFGETVEAKRVQDAGLFEYHAPAYTTFNDYKVYHHGGLLGHDPYSFYLRLVNWISISLIKGCITISMMSWVDG